MGFFSVNCLGCGHSLRSYAAHGAGHWTTFAVVLPRSGKRLAGEYDGYGRVGNHEDRVVGLEDASAYHRACWMVLGQPSGYTVRSEDASDQGYFVGAAPRRPLTLEDLATLRADAKREREESKQQWQDARESYGVPPTEHDIVDDIKF